MLSICVFSFLVRVLRHSSLRWGRPVFPDQRRVRLAVRGRAVPCHHAHFSVGHGVFAGVSAFVSHYGHRHGGRRAGLRRAFGPFRGGVTLLVRVVRPAGMGALIAASMRASAAARGSRCSGRGPVFMLLGMGGGYACGQVAVACGVANALGMTFFALGSMACLFVVAFLRKRGGRVAQGRARHD